MFKAVHDTDIFNFRRPAVKSPFKPRCSTRDPVIKKKKKKKKKKKENKTKINSNKNQSHLSRDASRCGSGETGWMRKVFWAYLVCATHLKYLVWNKTNGQINSAVLSIPVHDFITGYNSSDRRTKEAGYDIAHHRSLRELISCINKKKIKFQEAHGSRLSHLNDIATAGMQMLCNRFPILSSQLMKRSSFKQFLILKKNIYMAWHLVERDHLNKLSITFQQ